MLTIRNRYIQKQINYQTLINIMESSTLNHSIGEGDQFISSEPNGFKREAIFWKINQYNYFKKLIGDCRLVVDSALQRKHLFWYGSFVLFLKMIFVPQSKASEICSIYNEATEYNFTCSIQQQPLKTREDNCCCSELELSLLVDSFTEISWMNKLTREFDLFVTSFIATKLAEMIPKC